MYNGLVYGQTEAVDCEDKCIRVQQKEPAKIRVAIEYLQGQVTINQSLSRRILLALVGDRPTGDEKSREVITLSEKICSQGQELEETNNRLEEVLHILYANLGENIKLE